MLFGLVLFLPTAEQNWPNKWKQCCCYSFLSEVFYQAHAESFKNEKNNLLSSKIPKKKITPCIKKIDHCDCVKVWLGWLVKEVVMKAKAPAFHSLLYHDASTLMTSINARRLWPFLRKYCTYWLVQGCAIQRTKVVSTERHKPAMISCHVLWDSDFKPLSYALRIKLVDQG